MDWIDKFISSFAAETAYQYRDQKDVYKNTQQGTTGINQEKTNPTSNQHDGGFEETHREDGEDPETGEEFKVEVHKFSLKPKDPKNKQEMDWVSQEAIVTITSLNDETRSIHSSLSDLCQGKYGSLISLSSKEIAKKLVESHKDIFGHIEATMASYSSVINANNAFRLVQAASASNVINSKDYNVIRNKVENSQLASFDELVSRAGIEISSADSNADYYLAYIRDFQEYKTRNESALLERVSGILGAMKEGSRAELINKLRKDEVLSKFIKQ